jgi:photosystem II stability/assembly factor-like uncharacterized protein
MYNNYLVILCLIVACEPSARKTEVDFKTVQNTAPPIVYYSTNAGKSWIPYSAGIPTDATVSSFAVKENTLYASTDLHGIYSNVQGVTQWQRVDKDLPEGTDINDMAILGETFLAATFNKGILISKNRGVNWSSATLNVTQVPVRALFVKDEIIFAGTDHGIYKSIDKGDTWHQIYKGVQVNGFTQLNGNVYAALSKGALISKDSGQTWKNIYESHALHDISTDGQSIFAMTLGEGLLKTADDGVTWQNVNEGLGKLYTFEVKQFDNTLFAAQWQGIYASQNGGKTWQMIKHGLPDSTAFTTLEKTSIGLVAGIGLRKK